MIIFNTVCIIILFILVGLFILKSNKPHLPTQSIFDQTVIGEGSLKVFDNFIDREFNIFLHKIFNKYENSDKYHRFLTECRDSERIRELCSGFVLRVKCSMSDDLRILFYRIYKASEDEEELNKYIGDWFMYRVRRVENVYNNLIGNNRSQDNVLGINNTLLLDLENVICKSMHIDYIEHEEKKRS